MSKNEPKHELFLCDCFSADHQMIFTYVEDENWEDVYVNVHLNHYFPFWKRIKIGIKYIFGWKSRYGSFDEFIFHPGDSKKLQKVVDYLKEVESRVNINFKRFEVNKNIYRFVINDLTDEQTNVYIKLIQSKLEKRKQLKNTKNTMMNLKSERQINLMFGDLVFFVSKHKNDIKNPQRLIGQKVVIDNIEWKIKYIEEGIGKENKKTDIIGIVVV